jgi:hypothetical protein
VQIFAFESGNFAFQAVNEMLLHHLTIPNRFIAAETKATAMLPAGKVELLIVQFRFVCVP